MRTIGLLGGMSWESTVTYYQIINRTVKEQLGGLHSAKLLLYSVDFYEIEACMRSGRWIDAASLLGEAALRLQNAGANFVLICTNTLHKVAPEVRQRLSIPLLHIAEVTADTLLARGITKAALLGTRYTMEQDFYTATLQGRGIEVLVPPAKQREWLNKVIFNELVLGRVTEEARTGLLDIIGALAAQGAEGAVLGCTELGMLINEKDTNLPVLDTAILHAEKAALLSLRDG